MCLLFLEQFAYFILYNHSCIQSLVVHHLRVTDVMKCNCPLYVTYNMFQYECIILRCKSYKVQQLPSVGPLFVSEVISNVDTDQLTEAPYNTLQYSVP
jgi:hypothetical protein